VKSKPKEVRVGQLWIYERDEDEANMTEFLLVTDVGYRWNAFELPVKRVLQAQLNGNDDWLPVENMLHDKHFWIYLVQDVQE